MTATEEQRKVKALLEETIVLLCKNGLDYKTQFTVEALIGITLDQKNVILINIKETIFNDSCTEADLYDESLEADKRSHTSNEQEHNGIRSEDEEFGFNEDLHPSTSSESLIATSQNNEYSNNLANLSSQQSKYYLQTADQIAHASQVNYNSNGNNENTQPFSQSHDRQSSSQQKRSLQVFGDGKASNNDNHYITSSKGLKSKHQRTVLDTSVDTNPLSSHNPTDENASRTLPLNVHMFKSEPPDFEEMPNAARDSFGSNSGSNNIPSGSLSLKWHPDEFLSDLSNMVHGTGLNRTTHLSGKDGTIEGISSLLNLPLQSQPHLPHSIPLTMPTSNPAMSLSSPFLEPTNIRPNYPPSHTTGSKARYKCSLCFKEVRLLRDLRAHMATKHNLEKDFSCSVCGTGFTYKHNLFVHLRTVHKLNDRLIPSVLTS